MCDDLKQFIEYSKRFKAIYIDPVSCNDSKNSRFKIMLLASGDIVGTGDTNKKHVNIWANKFDDYNVLAECAQVIYHFNNKRLESNVKMEIAHGRN